MAERAAARLTQLLREPSSQLRLPLALRLEGRLVARRGLSARVAVEARWRRRHRVAVEAGHTDFWHKYVGLDGRVVGMSSFGESAPAEALFQHFGLTADNVVAAVEDVILD